MNKTFWTKKAQKQLAKLPGLIKARVTDGVDTLTDTWPNSKNVVSLTNRPEYRLRVGDYRVLFLTRPDGGIIVLNILEVRKRDEQTYRH